MRWAAMEELARRALQDHSLLELLCGALRTDKTVFPRYRPWGTWLAVACILDSSDAVAINLLLAELEDWTSQEQEDAISPWTGYGRVMEGSRELAAKYGWAPKYLRDRGTDANGTGE